MLSRNKLTDSKKMAVFNILTAVNDAIFSYDLVLTNPNVHRLMTETIDSKTEMALNDIDLMLNNMLDFLDELEY